VICSVEGAWQLVQISCMTVGQVVIKKMTGELPVIHRVG
jgi:hypothetical protein